MQIHSLVFALLNQERTHNISLAIWRLMHPYVKLVKSLTLVILLNFGNKNPTHIKAENR